MFKVISICFKANLCFFRYYLFFDQARFYSDRELNKQNCHYWSPENPHWYITVDHQHRWCLTVWCGIINGYLIGPYFFQDNVNSHSYLEVLRDWLPELLENVDLATRQRMGLQQDGSAPHCARIVREFLNNILNNINILKNQMYPVKKKKITEYNPFFKFRYQVYKLTLEPSSGVPRHPIQSSRYSNFANFLGLF